MALARRRRPPPPSWARTPLEYALSPGDREEQLAPKGTGRRYINTNTTLLPATLLSDFFPMSVVALPVSMVSFRGSVDSGVSYAVHRRATSGKLLSVRATAFIDDLRVYVANSGSRCQANQTFPRPLLWPAGKRPPAS